nr:MAG TPA_asm: hypothetical protein [Caudoviricetes sp.]
MKHIDYIQHNQYLFFPIHILPYVYIFRIFFHFSFPCLSYSS